MSTVTLLQTGGMPEAWQVQSHASKLTSSQQLAYTPGGAQAETSCHHGRHKQRPFIHDMQYRNTHAIWYSNQQCHHSLQIQSPAST
jgi:hypothetical protein